MAEQLQAHHLLPQVRAVLNWSGEKRITLIRNDSLIPYDLEKKILSRMEELRLRPRAVRPLGLLITGSSGNGKTTILNEFRKRNPSYGTPPVEIKPVVYVEAPPTAGEKRLLGALLRALGYKKDWDKGDVDSKLSRVLHALSTCAVQVLIIDEIHNFLIGRKQLWESLNVIKTLSNELRLPIVLAGIETAEYVIKEDPQVSSRFPLLELPLWRYGKEYLDFLIMLESTLPIAKRSRLYSKEKARPLLELSGLLDSGPSPRAGILGNIVKLVKEGAVSAIRDGSECISADHLKSAAKEYRYSSGVDEDLKSP